MIILVGASASGKTELSKRLRTEFGMRKAITFTTRPPRPGERDGIDYHFVSDADFELLKKRGEFIESTVYDGHPYGSSKKEIDDDKVVIVDTNGLEAYLALDDPSLVAFFLKATIKTREARMRGRGDDVSDIKRRLEDDKARFSPDKVKKCHFVVKTDGKKIGDIADEVYWKYVEELKKRGIHPNLLIQ